MEGTPRLTRSGKAMFLFGNAYGCRHGAGTPHEPVQFNAKP
jgi:hypothetical protein